MLIIRVSYNKKGERYYEKALSILLVLVLSVGLFAGCQSDETANSGDASTGNSQDANNDAGSDATTGMMYKHNN